MPSDDPDELPGAVAVSRGATAMVLDGESRRSPTGSVARRVLAGEFDVSTQEDPGTGPVTTAYDETETSTMFTQQTKGATHG
jgi:hypothetical protein